jgi:hypothetical protein
MGDVFMKLTKNRLIEELVGLDTLFGGRKSREEVIELAKQWWEHCEYMSDINFVSAIRMYKQSGKFFPVPADIIELHHTIASRAPHKQIEQNYIPLSKEEAQPYIDNIRKILKKNMLNNKRRKSTRR